MQLIIIPDRAEHVKGEMKTLFYKAELGLDSLPPDVNKIKYTNNTKQKITIKS